MVNQEEIQLLGIAAKLTAITMDKVQPPGGAGLALDPTVQDKNVQAFNVMVAGVFHTFYAALVAIVADTTDWPVPTQAGQGGRNGGNPAPPLPPVTPPSVSVGALPAAVKAAMALGLLILAFAFPGIAKADCLTCKQGGCTVDTGGVSTPASCCPCKSVPAYWQESCHRRGGQGGGCGQSAPGCQTSACVSVRVTFFHRLRGRR